MNFRSNFASQSHSTSPERKKWVWDVTGAVIKGLRRGQTDFKTKGNLIAICICLRQRPDFWFSDTLELVADKNFHEEWLVGVDIAGGLSDSSAGSIFKISTIKCMCALVLQGI